MKKIILIFALLSLTQTASAFNTLLNVEPETLINLDNRLSSNYSPNDLVPAGEFGIVLAKDKDLPEMSLSLAQGLGDGKDNLPSKLRDLMYFCETKTGEISFLRSGYRSYNTQQYLYNKFSYGVAIPGTSEHQSGLAADINIQEGYMNEQSKTYKCFSENAFKYGFILSYPKYNNYLGNKSTFEPWHWRYVGTEIGYLITKYKRTNYPQEFIKKLDYFKWLSAENIMEDKKGLNQIKQKYGIKILRDKKLRNFYLKLNSTVLKKESI